MSVAAFTTGGSSANNTNVPTNPKITANSTHSNTALRLFTTIQTDDTNSNFQFIRQGDADQSNLATTKGYRIKCQQSSTQTGTLFNPADWDNVNKTFTSYDYFVMVYSDNHLLHHFAKITEVIQEDTLGDAFEFSPRIGNEIPKDTKFTIFRGPSINSNVVAFSASVKIDLQNELVCSRPLFYFYDEKLDKKGELDHNKKYYLSQMASSASTVDFNVSPYASRATILTTQEYLGDIIDYGRFTMKAQIIDNLRILDESGGVSNEGQTITGFGTNSNYDAVFVNARRNSGTNQYIGEYRYLTYDYSPNCVNIIPNVIQHKTHSSFNNITGFSETVIADTFRLSSIKLKENDFYGVRHRVFTGETQDWKNIESNIISINTVAGHSVLTLDINDISSFIVAGNEIKINETICIVKTVAGTDITLENQYRSATDGIFTSGTPTLTTDDLIYRKEFNPLNNTLLTDFKLIEGREKDLFVRFDGNAFGLLEAKVSSVDKNNKLITIEATGDIPVNDSYDGNVFIYMNGAYSIEINRFEGEIENMETYNENAQTYARISGRDNFNKILSPLINKDTAFSEDIIYSSQTPYDELIPFSYDSNGDGVNDIHIKITSASFNSENIQFSQSINIVSELPSSILNHILFGSKIFAKLDEHIVFVGELSGTSGIKQAGTDVPLQQNSQIDLGDETDAKVYVSRTKKYLLNKALSTSSSADSTSDLLGASDKGVLFTGGYSINGSGESLFLPNTSVNTTNALARGYHISRVQNIKDDSYFLFNLGNDANPETYSDFDSINSLIDFTVISVKDNGALKEIEIAPHNPILLARKDNNMASATSSELTTTDRLSVSLGTLGYDISIGAKRLTLPNNMLGHTEAERFAHNNMALYANGEYVGTIGTSSNITDTSVRIGFLAPTKRAIGSSEQLSIIGLTTEGNYTELNKKTHELSIVNGGFLHGGKFISLLSPFTNGNRPATLDFIMKQTNATNFSYSQRFGKPNYRIFDIEKGSINRKNHNMRQDKNITDYFSEKRSSIEYYAKAYKPESGFLFEDGVYKNNLLGANRRLTSKPHKEIEERGITSVFGSKMFDADILPNNFTALLPLDEREESVGFDYDFFPSQTPSDAAGSYLRPVFDNFKTKSCLELRDTTADRMFLFSVSDLRPAYPKKGPKSIMRSSFTRSTTDYGIIGIGSPDIISSPQVKDNDGVNTSLITYKDKDYSLSSIQSTNKEINTLQMFSIMRLTELVLDFAFNPINIEHEDSPEKVIPPFTVPNHNISQYIGNNKTVTLASSGNHRYDGGGFVTSHNLIGVGSLEPGDIICTPNGIFIGEVQFVTYDSVAGETTVDFIHPPYRVENGNLYYGPIRRIRNTDIVNTPRFMGSGNKDTFANMDSSPSLSKTVVAKYLSSENQLNAATIQFKVSFWSGVGGFQGKYIEMVVPTSNTSGSNTYRFELTPDNPDSSVPTPKTFVGVDGTDWARGEPSTRILNRFIDALESTDIFDYVSISGSSPNSLTLLFKYANSATTESASLLGGSTDLVNVSLATGSNFTDGFGGSVSGSDSIYEQPESDPQHTSFGSRIGGTFGADRLGQTIFPYVTQWGHNSNLGNHIRTTFNFHESKETNSFLFRHLFMCNKIDSNLPFGATTHKSELFMKDFLPIILGTFSAEEESQIDLDYGTVGRSVRGISRNEFTTNDELMTFTMSLKGGVGTLSSYARGNLNLDMEAKGVHLGFKPVLKMPSGSSNIYDSTNNTNGYFETRALNGETVYNYLIETGTGLNSETALGNEYAWLDLVDLTGCYLASSRGSTVDVNNEPIARAANHNFSMNNVMPYKIAYVISHEIDTTDVSTRHWITVDCKLDADKYRIMQPNHVCFNDGNVKDINLYEMSSRYTLNPITGKPYDGIKSFSVKNKKGNLIEGDNEAALSMYVLIDNSNIHHHIDTTVEGGYEASNRNTKFLVVRDVQEKTYGSSLYTKLDDLMGNLPLTMVFSDGDEFVKSSIVYAQTRNSGNDSFITHSIRLGDIKKLKGVVSVSEPMTLQVTNDFNSDSKRCLIGNTVKICHETNDLVNKLLEEEGIDFEIKSEEDYPLFVAPDIRGKSLLDTLNLILSKKNKNIIYYDNKFIIRNKNNNDNYPQVELSEDSGIKIYEYSKDKSMFDIYNEITVYGASHRAIRRNVKSQNKIGRKSLEHFSDELTTQEEVDAKAIELLKIHSELSETFTFKIGHNNVSQLRAGYYYCFSTKRKYTYKSIHCLRNGTYY